MSDMGEVVHLLEALVSEIQALRDDFNEFTGYNTAKMQNAIDAVTGPDGYHMQDLNNRLYEVISGLSAIETAIDLK